MTVTNLAPLVAVVVALISAGVAARSSQRTHKLEVSKVDAEAYERAKTFTDRLVDDLRQEVERLNTQIAQLRVELEAEERENDALRKQVTELSKTANNLRYELTILQNRLRGA